MAPCPYGLAKRDNREGREVGVIYPRLAQLSRVWYIAAVAALGGCSVGTQSNELTREKAAELINASSFQTATSSVDLAEQTLFAGYPERPDAELRMYQDYVYTDTPTSNALKADGRVGHNWSSFKKLDPLKTLIMVGAADGVEVYLVGGSRNWIFEARPRLSENVENICSRQSLPGSCVFPIMKRKVVSVTGVKGTERAKVVEFSYTETPTLYGELLGMVGAQKSAAMKFELYDDGWRLK